MKTLKMIMLIALVAVGTTVFASDDPKTTKENTTESPKEQCQDLLTTQLVNFQVRFTDCPDYLCEVKNCTLYVCIVDIGGTLLCTPIPFNDSDCTYDFERITAEVGVQYYARLIKSSGDCTFHSGLEPFVQIATGVTDYATSTHLCQP